MSTANIGRTVTWYVATLAGNAAPKSPRTGIIVAYIPCWTNLTAVAAALDLHGVRVTAQNRSRVDRYLVRIDRANAAGKALTPDWYAPVAGTINVALAAGEAGSAP